MIFITIDNVPSTVFGLCVYDTPEIPVPHRDIEIKEIRGRNGSLTKKYAYKNIEFDVILNLMDTTGIKNTIRQIKPWILNGKKISFSDDPGFYYQIVHGFIPDNIENTLGIYGFFAAKFIAKPFQYKETAMEVIKTTPKTFAYSGTVEGEPYIKVVGSGDVAITLNGSVFQLNNIVSYLELDSESKQVYKGTSPQGVNMTGEFPKLKPGNNTISWTGTVTEIQIDKREAYL